MRAIAIGETFGGWTVISEASVCNERTVYICRCVCGHTKAVRAGELLSGKSSNCSCQRNVQHAGFGGRTHRRLYDVWRSMKWRCYNPNHDKYHCYGGKGVRICQSWLTSFMTFRDWALSNGYAPGLSIDRIDNDGNYKPENCRWLTKSENTKRQKGTPKHHSYRSESRLADPSLLTTAQTAAELGITPAALRQRVFRGSIKSRSPGYFEPAEVQRVKEGKHKQ